MQKSPMKETIFCKEIYNFIDPTYRSHPIYIVRASCFLCCPVCVAVCCSVAQCVAVCFVLVSCACLLFLVLSCVYCSVFYCVAVCCSVLQCVARMRCLRARRARGAEPATASTFLTTHCNTYYNAPQQIMLHTLRHTL